jgi:hypothetical protein
MFWDRQGILLVEFLPQGTTINAAVYCETLNKLRRAIQNKRCSMLSPGVVFLHDNRHPHAAARTRQLLASFKWELVNHAPTDFQLFLHLKRFLASKKFYSDDKLKERVEKWLTSQVADF